MWELYLLLALLSFLSSIKPFPGSWTSTTAEVLALSLKVGLEQVFKSLERSLIELSV